MKKRIRLLRRAGAIRAAARHGLADVAQAHTLEERVWDLEPPQPEQMQHINIQRQQQRR